MEVKLEMIFDEIDEWIDEYVEAFKNKHTLMVACIKIKDTYTLFYPKLKDLYDECCNSFPRFNDLIELVEKAFAIIDSMNDEEKQNDFLDELKSKMTDIWVYDDIDDEITDYDCYERDWTDSDFKARLENGYRELKRLFSVDEFE